MAASLEDTGVTYGELADLEAEFEDVETEIIRKQFEMTKPLYEKRERLVSQIPNFWPLVLEQAPPDIDEWIQPTDSAVLLMSLTRLSVSHFEIENGGNGEPRSVSIRWEFNENDYFEDRVLEKKFWYRRSPEGYTALVSEPVEIRWKEGKDLTNGLLSLVKAVWDEEQQNGVTANKKEKKPLTAKQQALKAKIEEVGLGGQSFFCWFGYIGDRISAEESAAASAKEAENRARKRAGQPALPEAEEKEDEDDEDDDDDELEIFPAGEEVAIAISDDLWPGALKYFIHAQEDDEISDREFEEMMDQDSDEDDEMEE
ncbi:Nucleosome assembly protein (NAP) [Rhypophila sp. PSN 637]|uniref:Nucleosome assembly protein n=1 Tax=Rhypophila decipiens TaxID=261697 RepID=A0AAN7BDJ6_9PEZI|nr:nucleosome assembly protein [Rhypophila decipiens]